MSSNQVEDSMEKPKGRPDQVQPDVAVHVESGGQIQESGQQVEPKGSDSRHWSMGQI